MIFGPDKDITREIKAKARQSKKIGTKEIKKAIRVSRILKNSETHTKPKTKYRPAKTITAEHGFTKGQQLFSVGTGTLLKMMELHTFTLRELTTELDVSAKIARRWIDKVETLGIIKQVENQFGETAYQIDTEELENAIEEVKTALDQLKGGNK